MWAIKSQRRLKHRLLVRRRQDMTLNFGPPSSHCPLFLDYDNIHRLESNILDFWKIKHCADDLHWQCHTGSDRIITFNIDPHHHHRHLDMLVCANMTQMFTDLVFSDTLTKPHLMTTLLWWIESKSSQTHWCKHVFYIIMIQYNIYSLCHFIKQAT